MSKSKLKISKKQLYVIVGLFGLISVTMTLLFGFFVYYNGRFYPNTKIAGQSVSGMSLIEAKTVLERKNAQDSLDIVIKTTGGELSYKLPFEQIELEYDYNTTLAEAFRMGRTNNLSTDISDIFNLLVHGVDIYPNPSYNHTELKKQVDAMVASIPNPPIYPTYVFVGNRVDVEQGTAGEFVDKALLLSFLKSRINLGQLEPYEVSTKLVDPTMTEEETVNAIARAERLVGKSLELEHDEGKFTYSGSSLTSLLSPSGGVRQQEIDRISLEVSSNLNREAQNPVFEYREGRVEEFTPGVQGVLVNNALLENEIVSTLNDLLSGDTDTISVNIPTTKTEPSVSLSEINDLGIHELIGVGTSEFAGSNAERIYNVSLAASKFDGVLIAPGEVFSFNEIIGDISAATGFKQSYVIQDGATVLGDGGGVCQVSTTMFRAALNSGLPIVERNQHSYRVYYYEQDSKPGIDATIYHPTVDFKFKNDTPNHILVQSRIDISNRKLALEFYGTRDGRIVSITTPQVLAASAPPPDLYIDDPTLPAGEVKQIDWAAGGANVVFDYKVVRDGEILQEKTFRSNYRPWQAKFLRGTGPGR